MMALTTKRLVAALRKVPEKKLRIIDLVKAVTVKGEVDYNLVSEKQKEINLAEAEARAYIQMTHQAQGALRNITAC
ncbi:MAG: hypothetical protein JW901_05330 [Dehalococcoidia bacterium]|nr:hypothetical protein [Dehalococcoidia bacterium]